MIAVGAAIAALLCFLLAFILGLAGTEIGVDLVTLGLVFVAAVLLVMNLPATRRL
jgi:hypothetical protein